MIKFRKLYDNNPLEGVNSFAIITYIKREYLIKTRDDIDIQFVSQYKKHLMIDCWLLVLRFTWLTKEGE